MAARSTATTVLITAGRIYEDRKPVPSVRIDWCLCCLTAVCWHSLIMDCAKCARALPADGRPLTCASCRRGYHLGKSCSGVADGTYAGMGAVRRETWKCSTCRTGATLRPSDLSGDISVDESSRTDGSREEIVDYAPFTSQLASINATLNQLLSLRTSVETLLPLPSKVDQLLALKPAVEELRNTVQGLQTTVDSFSLKYDSVLALAMTNEEAVKELQKEVNTVKATMTEQSETIERLKDELNDMQQYSRRSNMELHGFPLSHGEDLMKVISDLARPLNLPTPQSSDILAIHRLTKKPDSVPVILIRFASVTLKDAWMALHASNISLSNFTLPFSSTCVARIVAVFQLLD
ncbi:uncharacterized protein LOC115313456 [Ixodes scapularis]|uniref:uncharacterized protein LOC115313456 n=1 Tax=Ixodes scapularis TaxID=6945 RepID=UPI001A9E9C65|nr:uncharacterized protein LOC115313456 [Ixodes scapularis]